VGVHPRRRARCRVRRGRGKKLRAALRYDLERRATDDFLRELAEEEPDAAPFAADAVRPDDAQWPEWAGVYRGAWEALRDDRHYGAMGGLGRIYYSAIDRYAERHGIAGSAFDDFLTLVHAMDEEYVAHVTRRQRAEAGEGKGDGKP